MQAWSIVVTLLVGLASIGNAEVCQAFRFRIGKKEKCLDYAHVANPSVFVQFPNATCYFHNVCFNATSPEKLASNQISYAPCVLLNKKTVSFHEKYSEIISESMDLPFTKRCPKFKKIGKRRKMLLLRTHASFGESPYKLLREGPVSPVDLSFTEANKERKNSFKSPLFAVVGQGSLKEIHIELLDEEGRLKVRLGFAFRPEDDIREGSWFAADRLIFTWPWRLKDLRQHAKFDVFSIHGGSPNGYPAVRRFHISLVNSGYCSQHQGILAVVEKATCAWEQENKYFPAYLYNSKFRAVWRSKKKEASEFRILGIFNEKTQIFVRKSQKCK